MPYQSKITKSELVAEKTLGLWFEKPTGFTHRAGQFLELLIAVNGKKTSHNFSICSAPSESELSITTRLTGSDFKNSLLNLRPSDRIEFNGPMGQFTLPNDKLKQIVFLTGGIGITPFYSMLKEEAAMNSQRGITLFYSNRIKKGAAFLDELENFARPNLKIVATMTDDPAWPREKGRIDEALLKKHLPDILKPIYYIAGPPSMVASLNELLKKLAVPEEQIRLEEFAGY